MALPGTGIASGGECSVGESGMAAKAAKLVTLVALVLTGCDLAQTGSTTLEMRPTASSSTVTPSQPFAMRAAPGADDPTEMASGTPDELRATGKSMRLHGPGVSRKLQMEI
jgi:hypothetical protein